jgi:hypothetical protein
MDTYLAAAEQTKIKAKTTDQNIILENSFMRTFRMTIFFYQRCNRAMFEICRPVSFFL